MIKRYVSGRQGGQLQGNRGETARTLLQKREMNSDWFARNYPIIYELVPVSAENLKPPRREVTDGSE